MRLPFFGREQELTSLRQLLHKTSASLVIVKGRRRIGKSRLIQEVAKPYPFHRFSGLPPTAEVSAQDQRTEFARQLAKELSLPGLRADDWGDLFDLLAKQTGKGRVILLLDEISWMGFKDPTFLGKLKNAWDLEFSKNPELILILCGSVSTWIEKNIIQSTGFLGRPSLYVTLDELSLPECNQFWGKRGQKISTYEKLKFLAVTGGIPRYLELMDPSLSSEENIRRLCFLKDSPLLNEFDFIFSDIFSKRSVLYRQIVEQLIHGARSQEEISKKTALMRSGDLSHYLEDLVLSGFVTRDHSWHLKTGHISKLSKYRLKDNYLRFHLKYLQPNKPKIEKGVFAQTTLTAMPGWDTWMGLQFENLVANNHLKVSQILGITPEGIVFSNPFFQRKTARQPGCQVDYLIQTRFDTVYLCEVKFSRFEIGMEVVKETQEKMARLKLPRHVSCRPVLIHVNGVRGDVKDSLFFSDLIDFGQFLG